MNDEKQVLKLAAERLLAVANGATLEWVYDNTEVVTATASIPPEVLGGDKVRIRPPAVAPEPKPSQEWLDGHGVELTGEYRAVRNGDLAFDSRFVCPQECSVPECWSGPHWILRKRAPIAAPSLSCPPRPTPDQVAAARMPDGRQVKEPTVCEVPNGRAYFSTVSGKVLVDTKDLRPSEFPRWIAEPADAVVEPWTRDTCPVGSVVVDTDGARCQIAEACDEVMKYGGHRQCTYDWALHNLKTHNGQPCGVAK